MHTVDSLIVTVNAYCRSLNCHEAFIFMSFVRVIQFCENKVMRYDAYENQITRCDTC